MKKVFEPKAIKMEGNLEADLSHFGNQGTAQVYLKLRPPSNTGTFLGPSENPPISSWAGQDDTNFHFWVTAPLGNNWQSVLLAGGNNPPTVSICRDGTGAEFYKGWELKEGVVTATPIYTNNITSIQSPMIQIDPVSSGTVLTPTSPLNSITNAVAIVITNNPTADNTTMVAITKYSPASLNLTPTDPRITWAIDQDHRGPGPAGDAGFLGNNNHGTVVKVFGKTEGRVVLSATLQDPTVGQLAESYEAVVVQEKIIPFRVNLFRALVRKGGVPIGTNLEINKADEAENQIAIANRYLRPIGVRLVPDPNTTIFGNSSTVHTRLLKPGFFRTLVADSNLVVNVDVPHAEDNILINDDPKVIQINYVESYYDYSATGATINYPENVNSPNITVNYRIRVDDIARNWTMNLLGPNLQFFHPSAWGVLIFNTDGDPVADAQAFAQTVSHELGHIMCLRHRQFSQDNLPLDPKNLMHARIITPLPEDLDLIQLEGARGSDAIH